MSSGNDLLKVFKTVEVDIGKLDATAVKAWFDTDCAPMLEWMCAAITEECHISAQEEKEFNSLDQVLTLEQIAQKKEVINQQYPGLFNYEATQNEITFFKNLLEVLQDQIQDLNNQIVINGNLQTSLLAEYSGVYSEELKLQAEEESAHEQCDLLSKELDSINIKLHSQIVKYAGHLSNYASGGLPTFVNDVSFAEMETEITDYFTSHSKLFVDLNNMSFCSSAALTELRHRMISSIVSLTVAKMEMEGLNASLNYLNNCDISFDLEMDSFGKSDDNLQNTIEKIAEYQAACSLQPSLLKYLKNELNTYELILRNLVKVKKELSKLLHHSTNVFYLCLEENQDIANSLNFFKYIITYVRNDLYDSIIRKKLMAEFISKFENTSVEKKICLVGGDTNKELKHFIKSDIIKIINIIKKHSSHSVLNDFLSSGPTSELVIIPTDLKLLLDKVNENMKQQEASINYAVIHSTRKAKNVSQKSQMLKELWMLFMADSSSVNKFLEECKKNL